MDRFGGRASLAVGPLDVFASAARIQSRGLIYPDSASRSVQGSFGGGAGVRIAGDGRSSLHAVGEGLTGRVEAAGVRPECLALDACGEPVVGTYGATVSRASVGLVAMHATRDLDDPGTVVTIGVSGRLGRVVASGLTFRPDGGPARALSDETAPTVGWSTFVRLDTQPVVVETQVSRLAVLSEAWHDRFAVNPTHVGLSVSVGL